MYISNPLPPVPGKQVEGGWAILVVSKHNTHAMAVLLSRLDGSHSVGPTYVVRHKSLKRGEFEALCKYSIFWRRYLFGITGSVG